MSSYDAGYATGQKAYAAYDSDRLRHHLGRLIALVANGPGPAAPDWLWPYAAGLAAAAHDVLDARANR